MRNSALNEMQVQISSTEQLSISRSQLQKFKANLPKKSLLLQNPKIRLGLLELRLGSSCMLLFVPGVRPCFVMCWTCSEVPSYPIMWLAREAQTMTKSCS